MSTSISQVTSISHVIDEELARLKTRIPFPVGGLHAHLNEIATASPPAADPDENKLRVVRYLKSLLESNQIVEFTCEEELVKHFELFLTDPLSRADDDLHALEERIERVIKEHKIMKLINTDFEEKPNAATLCIKDFIAIISRLALVELRSFKTRRVELLEKLFIDPTGPETEAHIITRDMRRRLHDQENILTVLSLLAEGLLDSCKSEITRVTFIRSLHSALNERLDPFSYIRMTHPDVEVRMPDRPLPFVNNHCVRSILLHLVGNATKYGSTDTSLYLAGITGTMATIVVEDNCPGGIPEHLKPLLGNTIITGSTSGGSGLMLIKKSILPKLGGHASMNIESPIRNGDGSRVTLILPLTKSVKGVGTTYETPDSDVLPLFTPPTRATKETAIPHPPDESFRTATEFGVPGFVERLNAGGMSMFKIASSSPVSLELTFRLPSLLR